MFTCVIQTDDFDVGDAYQHLVSQAPKAGAVVFFVGRVRDYCDSATITGLSLEHYPGMTERTIQQILNKAERRFGIDAASVVHRVGVLEARDNIVFVGVASAHRGAAFDAAEFIMDFLKTSAPFWKKELLATGESVWVEARHQDNERASRWSMPSER